MGKNRWERGRSVIAPNIAEPATNGGADHNHRRSDNQKNRSSWSLRQNSQYLDPCDIFNLPHRQQTNAQMSLRIFYEKTNVQTNKKQDIYNVAANQILNWHIYISFTTSEMLYKPTCNHCRHLAWVFAVRMYSDSHQGRHNNIHNNVKALSSYSLTQHIFENIFISCKKKRKLWAITRDFDTCRIGE